MKKVKGSSEKFRVNIFKSNTAIYCQLIDDINNKIIASISSRNLNKTKKNCNIEDAKKTGEAFGEKLVNLKINNVVFDRNGYLYHGKVLALADGIRSKGIKF